MFALNWLTGFREEDLHELLSTYLNSKNILAKTILHSLCIVFLNFQGFAILLLELLFFALFNL
jgi:hypothetical protein